MSPFVSDTAASVGRVLTLPNGGKYVKRVYFGGFEKPATTDASAPQIYTVGQWADTVVEPHFHAVEQWQVFVEGDGTLGRHPARPGAVHYVDRHTGYGPIVAGTEGLTYFTIRAMTDPGAQFLHEPEAKARLKEATGSPKRYLYVPAEQVLPDRGVWQTSGGTLETLIAPHADGLAAWVARIGPSAELTAPEAAASGGQVLLVLAGGVRYDGEVLPRLSCAFIRHDVKLARLAAASSGAVVLVMNFPRIR